MKIYHSLENLQITNPVLTIGTFDGVHQGHQIIISRINELAQKIKGESVILTFHPHPRAVIHPDDHSLRLIHTMDEKIELLEKFGVQHLIIIPFSLAFSQMSADFYVKDFLYKNIQPKIIVIGYDHRFGKNREGGLHTFSLLKKDLNFEIEEISRQTVDDVLVSSTKIRKALLEGHINEANQWLGHFFTMTGTVVKGASLGKSLGFPTANIALHDHMKIFPKEGIYAVKVRLENTTYKAMLYIGKRPTFNGKEQTIEVNIFDFSKNIYNQEISIQYIAHIRDDIRFTTADALIHQLKKDKEAAEKILENY